MLYINRKNCWKNSEDSIASASLKYSWSRKSCVSRAKDRNYRNLKTSFSQINCLSWENCWSWKDSRSWEDSVSGENCWEIEDIRGVKTCLGWEDHLKGHLSRKDSLKGYFSSRKHHFKLICCTEIIAVTDSKLPSNKISPRWTYHLKSCRSRKNYICALLENHWSTKDSRNSCLSDCRNRKKFWGT